MSAEQIKDQVMAELDKLTRDYPTPVYREVLELVYDECSTRVEVMEQQEE